MEENLGRPTAERRARLAGLLGDGRSVSGGPPAPSSEIQLGAGAGSADIVHGICCRSGASLEAVLLAQGLTQIGSMSILGQPGNNLLIDGRVL